MEMSMKLFITILLAMMMSVSVVQTASAKTVNVDQMIKNGKSASEILQKLMDNGKSIIYAVKITAYAMQLREKNNFTPNLNKTDLEAAGIALLSEGDDDEIITDAISRGIEDANEQSIEGTRTSRGIIKALLYEGVIVQTGGGGAVSP